MNQHTFDVLELSRILNELLEYCATTPGVHHLAGDGPRLTEESVSLLHRQVDQWRDIVEEGQDLFSGAPSFDPEEILSRLSREGTVLEGAQLAGIRLLAAAARKVFKAIRGADEAEELKALIQDAPDLSETTKAIGSVLDSDGEVKDSAVPALKSLRQTLARSR